MHAEHPAVHYRAQSEVIEHFTAPPPHIRAPILPLAFIVESIYLCDLTRFVISTNESDAFRISDLESEKEQKGFYAVEPSVHEITCGNHVWVHSEA